MKTPVTAGADDGAASYLLVAGDGMVSTYPLGSGALTIGRADDCDVRIDHPALSRRHAVVQPGPPRTVQDLGSTNGIRVGGRVHRGGDAIALRANDSFQIGGFSFVLVAGAGGELCSRSLRDATRVDEPTVAGVPPLVRELARGTANVIILGETGSGKEVLAETVHALSGRGGAFTRINCAALTESLLESELFGHEQGAFTGASARKIGLLESADRGTVLLDEIGEMPLTIQAKLLRAIERREVLRLGATEPRTLDVRFLAATNRDLPAAVAAGRFRSDLFFRLDGVTLVVPPLRERKRLIAPLAAQFLGATPAGEVLAALEAHSWPGNVRELRAVIERAALLARGGAVAVKHLAFAPPVEPTAAAAALTPPAEKGLDAEERAERARIVAALEQCAGNQTRAAQLLGVPRTSLAGKIALYRIPRPRPRR